MTSSGGPPDTIHNAATAPMSSGRLLAGQRRQNMKFWRSPQKSDTDRHRACTQQMRGGSKIMASRWEHDRADRST